MLLTIYFPGVKLACIVSGIQCSRREMRILVISELLNLTAALREVRASKKKKKRNIIKAVGIAEIIFLLRGF